MIHRLRAHWRAAGGEALLWLAVSALALPMLLASPLPGHLAVQWLAGARFAGAWFGPPAAAALLLALLVLVFVPVGLASAAWVRGRAVITDAPRAATAHLLAVLLGCSACAAGGLAAAAVGHAPWLPWVIAGAPGLIVGALLLPMRRRPLATPAGVLLRCLVLALALSVLLLALALLLLSPLRAPVAVGPPAPEPEPVLAAQPRAPGLPARLAALNPLALPAGQRASMRLTTGEVQQLLRLMLRRIDGKARVRAGADRARRALAWSASVEVPVHWRPYLNVQGAIAVRLRRGELVFDTCALRVGAVALPAWSCRNLLAGWYRPPALRAGAANGANVAGVGMLDALAVDAHGAAVTYRRLALQDHERRALQQLLGPGEVVEAAVAAQLLNLHIHAAHLQASGERFHDALQLAFRLAQVRSRVSDPVAENQGAVLALAMVFGDPDVALAAGLSRDPDVAALGERIGPLHLWGRVDWAQHFLLSAAFAQVATARVSNAVGLAKEQMDANGGSGFSFTDLLADRAGTAFGRRLGGRAEDAQRLQAHLAGTWRPGDIAPSPNGLPEGMQAAEFAARYGAVGSPAYRQVEAEIARRLRTAPLLMP